MSIFKQTTRQILIGGMLFILPLTIILIILKKAFEILEPLTVEIAAIFGDHIILGFTTVSITGVILLLVICYIAGLLIKHGIINFWGPEVEEALFRLIPSLQMIKFRMLPERHVNKMIWTPVLLDEAGDFRIAFITDDRDEKYYSLFVPDAPRMDAGEVRIVPKHEFKGHQITMKEAINAIFHFGRGMRVKDGLPKINPEKP